MMMMMFLSFPGSCLGRIGLCVRSSLYRDRLPQGPLEGSRLTQGPLEGPLNGLNVCVGCCRFLCSALCSCFCLILPSRWLLLELISGGLNVLSEYIDNSTNQL